MEIADKSLQSAGAAGIWRGDGVGLPFMNIFVSTWALLVAGLICALPMLALRVKNTTDIEDEDVYVSSFFSVAKTCADELIACGWMKTDMSVPSKSSWARSDCFPPPFFPSAPFSTSFNILLSLPRR